jgi:hypothetical protein
MMITEWAGSLNSAAKCRATQAGPIGDSFFGRGFGGLAVIAIGARRNPACRPALSSRLSPNQRRATRADHRSVSRPPTNVSTPD